jgi:hypothetical protein
VAASCRQHPEKQRFCPAWRWFEVRQYWKKAWLEDGS